MQKEKIVFDPSQAPIVTRVAQKDKEFEATVSPEKTAKSRKPKEKPKEPEKEKPQGVTFPIQAKVNKYAFIFLSSDIQEAWGIEKGKEYPISVDLKDGALIIKKA